MPIKIFDRKTDFACLAMFAGFIHWQIADYFDNWLNPPPGVPFPVWINVFAEILSNFTDIRLAARTLVATTALAIYRERFYPSDESFPTLQDVHDRIQRTRYDPRSHLARYQETILHRLVGLLQALGPQICSRRRLNWQRYLDSSWAISLENLPTDYQNLFISVTVAKILLHRMANNLRTSRLTELFVLDEASTVFRKQYYEADHPNLLLDYLAKSREFGIGFLIATQTLSGLADPVLANTATKILVGGAGLGTDYDIFASATGLTPPQRDFLRTLTMPGVACAKDPRYPYPFTLEVPRVVE